MRTPHLTVLRRRLRRPVPFFALMSSAAGMEVVQVCPVIIFLRANETHLRRVFFSISILYPLGPTQVVREKKEKNTRPLSRSCALGAGTSGFASSGRTRSRSCGAFSYVGVRPWILDQPAAGFHFRIVYGCICDELPSGVVDHPL